MANSLAFSCPMAARWMTLSSCGALHLVRSQTSVQAVVEGLRRLGTAAAAAVSIRRAVPEDKSRLSHVYPRDLVEDILVHSQKKCTPVSLKGMMDFGTYATHKNLVLAAQFLHQELPVRLAHRVAELDNLPHGLSAKKPIMRVRDWYIESFRRLRSFPAVLDPARELEFTALIEQLKQRHNNVVPTVAQGVVQLRKELEQKRGGSRLADMPEVHQWLDRFYMSRIGIRMLVGQHVALHHKPEPGHIGLIARHLSPFQMARHAIADARAICLRFYGSAPEVQIYGDSKFTFPYVPSHLHHMLFELLKNSLRAVQERFEDCDHMPHVRVVIADGRQEVIIKISDEGGGIPYQGLSKIWTYMYTTGCAHEHDFDELTQLLAGYGFGLPLSRLYARYFGGDLRLLSMEGYGTDVYLHLNRLGNVQEPLP